MITQSVIRNRSEVFTNDLVVAIKCEQSTNYSSNVSLSDFPKWIFAIRNTFFYNGKFRPKIRRRTYHGAFASLGLQPILTDTLISRYYGDPGYCANPTANPYEL